MIYVNVSQVEDRDDRGRIVPYQIFITVLNYSPDGSDKIAVAQLFIDQVYGNGISTDAKTLSYRNDNLKYLLEVVLMAQQVYDAEMTGRQE